MSVLRSELKDGKSFLINQQHIGSINSILEDLRGSGEGVGVTNRGKDDGSREFHFELIFGYLTT